MTPAMAALFFSAVEIKEKKVCASAAEERGKDGEREEVEMRGIFNELLHAISFY